MSDELRAHLLHGVKSVVFLPGEMNEIINFAYSHLWVSVRDGYDTIRISDREFAWGVGQALTRQFVLGEIATVTMREAIDAILKRDEMVRWHLEVIEQTPESVTYQIM